jgi:hypothetical protein
MLASRVAQTTATTGTSTYQLGTVPAGRISAISGYGNGGIGSFLVTMEGSNDWEIIWGTVTAGSPDTITRNLSHSSTGALISWPAGTKLIQSIELADGARFGNQGMVPTAGGTANARTLAFLPVTRVLRPGAALRFINGAAANTATDPTLAVDGLSAAQVKRPGGGQIPPGALSASALIEVVWDGTNWRLLALPPLSTTVSRAALQSIATGTTTNVSFDTEEADPLQAWVVGTPERVTVPAGVTRVAVRLSVRWGNSVVGARFAQIRLNGATLVASDIRVGSDGSGSHQGCFGEAAVAAGDYFEARVTHDVGSALNLVYAQMVIEVVA